jgi:hypothetical protein
MISRKVDFRDFYWAGSVGKFNDLSLRRQNDRHEKIFTDKRFTLRMIFEAK